MAAVTPGKSQLDGCGYGLFTLEDIAQHEFVIEYTGELIMHDEGVRREARRGEVFDEGSFTSYVFSLLDSEGIWVDAAIYGNHSRYINHEQDTYNVEPKILYVNGEYRIRFSATRNIQAGEELFFNYGNNFPNLTKKMIKDKTAEEDGPRRGRHPNKATEDVKSNGDSAKADDSPSQAKGRKSKSALKANTPRRGRDEADDCIDDNDMDNDDHDEAQTAPTPVLRTRRSRRGWTQGRHGAFKTRSLGLGN
ncbi:Histone-lysine N-methyltransferase EHMT1 like protein [Verticillium longisporum]|nr:Histone-lysine N-methyltransferase EHMT1 like protein [Verticillium longisporum]